MKYSLSDDTWDEQEIEELKAVIDSNRFTMGECVQAFEKMFAQKMGASYAIMTNSGSSANLLSIAAMIYSGRLKKGDEVLVTAVSWSTTYFPVVQMGLKIRFVDIDLQTLNVDVNELEKAITGDTKAVLAVNLLGNPNDFNAICNICKRHDLMLLEDNCESMGAVYDGRLTGTFGLVGSFSMYYSHHISTMEGGVCVTDDEELYHYMLAIRSHGWTRQLPTESLIYKKTEDSFYESFNFIVPGFNFRPLEIEAAIGIRQLQKLDKIVEQRRKNADYFKTKMDSDDRFMIQKEGGVSSWFGFSIVLGDRIKDHRNIVTDILVNNGIEVRPIVAGNFVRQRAVSYLDYSVSGVLVNADYIHHNGFFVGNHSAEIKNEIDLLVACLQKCDIK